MEREFELVDAPSHPQNCLVIVLNLLIEGAVLLLEWLDLLLDQGADPVLESKPFSGCRMRGLVSEHLGPVVDDCGAFRPYDALPFGDRGLRQR